MTLTLTIVDTPGFGGNLDNTNCWVPITDFIEDKYAEYLQEETKIQRNAHIVDNRYSSECRIDSRRKSSGNF